MPQRHTIIPLDSFPPGSKQAFTIADRRVALFNVEGKLHAIDDTCPHAGASLAAGSLKGTNISCPWHAIAFDVTSGRACLKGVDALQSFPVFVNGNQIEVEV